ncbi:MAG: hypothetical protein ACRDJO_11850, partial [Actinomycetota bacterium]
MTDERDWGRTEDFVPPADASGNGHVPAPASATPADAHASGDWEGPLTEPPEAPDTDFELFAPDDPGPG